MRLEKMLLLSQAAAISERPSFWVLFKEITKFRLSISVLFSSIVGYFLGAENIDWVILSLLVLGGYCMVGASNVFNQIIERDLDAMMERTKLRPLPSGQMMVNQAYDNMGLHSTQRIATIFDGITRHSPEGVWFKERAETVGFKQAVAERDSGDPIPPTTI